MKYPKSRKDLISIKFLKSRKIATLFLDEISKEQKRPNFKDGWWPHRFCSSRGEVGGPASEISDLLFYLDKYVRQIYQI